ncbi:MAG TPA: ORF6N domain-containing protein [Candidatus Onthousia excrementipullorum]|uniref:ORF6N domain-containing protein n=1 Tax=Candidatus Onthousia excrementipullorum TaxID=2840884 RepID=A0A9D1J2U9_9FIRM|nr:ORF6N domain-containing protein [Candidatus Onthousia excrementipullorum]
MNEVVTKENIKIEDMIYEIRGKQVMLDSDLAILYECANGTKTINQAVKRNINRFPNDFYFQLETEEFLNLKSQIGTSSWNNYGGIRKLPYVFTEQGVAMLATVLRTDIASEMSVAIMRAFVTMRKYISTNLLEQKYINNMVLEHDCQIKLLKGSFQKIEEKKKVNEIYFNGQIYDAYSKIQEIFKSANKRLVIIDAYADNTILDIVKRLKIEVIIITKPNNLLTKQDVEKYNKQYNDLTVIYNNTFHDRYFILDDEIIYHCGASINRIGYKTFSITLIGDEDVKNTLINKIKEIDKGN